MWRVVKRMYDAQWSERKDNAKSRSSFQNKKDIMFVGVNDGYYFGIVLTPYYEGKRYTFW